MRAGILWVAEIKSLTAKNEEKQLRLGLGQVLRYRHRLVSADKPVRAALVVQRRPSDESWLEVCTSLNVAIAWPDRFAELDSESGAREGAVCCFTRRGSRAGR